MFDFLGPIVWMVGMVATVAVTAVGFLQARKFVRKRLAYGDAVQNGAAPVLAGFGAALLAMPVVALLPVVGAGTAILFGVGVGAGVAVGVKDVRLRRLPGA
ncbi:MAG TPA: hypothetical protein VFX98_00830 [Longimicrobiaceae bacterium]|nr:hypothetical protein [Longimicrobiaceae bacterium]